MTRMSKNKIKKLVELEKVNHPDQSTENFEENLRRDISTDRQKFLEFLDENKSLKWERNEIPTQWIFEAWPTDFDELGEKMTSQVYFKMLKEEVVYSFDGWARKLGLCCSAVSKQVTRSYICNGGRGCEIRAGGTYFTREVDGVQTMFCKSHKNKSKTDGWTEHLNDEEEDEVRLRCRKCKRYAHVVCSLFDVTRSPELFLCKRCLVNKCEPILATKALGESKIAAHMMATLNPFFITIGCENTTVALLSSGYCDGVVQNTKLREWFKAVNAPEANPFIYKHIGVFQNSGDGTHDVQFFDMIVHEYVCGEKKGSVHLHYLDTNDHFRPYAKKGIAYRQIIAAYWVYAESVGFVDCHIHACPPQKGDSWLFWGHPKSQHYSTETQLSNFYAKTIDEAKENHNIVGHHPKFDLTKHNSIASIIKELYTEDGLWQKLIVSRLEKKKWSSEETLESFKTFVKNSLDAHKDVLFWVDIRKKTARKTDNIKILDRDEVFPSSFANTRDNWLDKQLEYNLQFDTVRTATYSTRMLLILLQQERKTLKRRQQAKRKCREDID
ncbi:hypothetical protein B9Z55_024868 [Caenorhabditis nigoni]|uniref:histone acetyltransferase n=2 Tax=Caenorhabditis nigoni TaxID=1611254 RepID=A0A2G5SWC9_9PELO|nr:hypothetical protein B9Z55_024868 [Caenorhabditis nigoni]